MAASAPLMSAASRPSNAGAILDGGRHARDGLAGVQRGGARLAPPDKAGAGLDAYRGASARRISSPAMMTGLRIGRPTAIGSIEVICSRRAVSPPPPRALASGGEGFGVGVGIRR